MKYNKLIIPYSNDNDIKNIFNILKSDKFCSFENNILSYVSIFFSKKMSIDAELQTISYNNNLEFFLKLILNETISDIKKFYEIDIIINIDFISNIVFNCFKKDVKEYGLLNSIYSLFFLIISSEKEHLKEITIFSIVFINNLLLFFGFYIKWDAIFENSFIGFWSELLVLAYEEINNDVIKNKLINHFLNHTKIYFMEPIFFDDNKDNLNINEKNIFIKITISKNNIDINKLKDLYEEKLKKIDRTLILICKNI